MILDIPRSRFIPHELEDWHRRGAPGADGGIQRGGVDKRLEDGTSGGRSALYVVEFDCDAMAITSAEPAPCDFAGVRIERNQGALQAPRRARPLKRFCLRAVCRFHLLSCLRGDGLHLPRTSCRSRSSAGVDAGGFLLENRCGKRLSSASFARHQGRNSGASSDLGLAGDYF